LTMQEWTTLISLMAQHRTKQTLYNAAKDGITSTINQLTSFCEDNKSVAEENAALSKELEELLGCEVELRHTARKQACNFQQQIVEITRLFNDAMELTGTTHEGVRQKSSIARHQTNGHEESISTRVGHTFTHANFNGDDPLQTYQVTDDEGPEKYHEDYIARWCRQDANQSTVLQDQNWRLSEQTWASEEACRVHHTQPSATSGATAPAMPPSDRMLQEGIQSVTTLMVRNVPARYTREKLLQEWPQSQLSFDLFYLPYDFQKKRFRGYAFLNFTSVHHAIAFKRQWHGQKLQHHGRCCKLDIVPAHLQGFQAMVRYVQDHLIDVPNGDMYLPAVFAGTRRISFHTVMSLPRQSHQGS